MRRHFNEALRSILAHGGKRSDDNSASRRRDARWERRRTPR
jgi:hypothetical protein